MASRGTAAAGKGPSAGPRTAAAPHPDAVAATAGVEREPGVRALQRQPCQGRPPPALAAADPNDDSHSGSSGRGSDYRHLRQGEGDDESDVEQSRQQQEQEDKGEEDDHHHQQQQQLQQRRWLRKRKPDDYMEEEEDQEVEEGEAEYQQQLQRERAQWLHQHKQQARVRKRRAVEFEAAPAVPMHPLGQQDTRPPQPPMGRASAGRAAAAAALMQAPAVARTAVGSAAGLAPRPVPPPAAAAAGGGGGLTHLPDSDNWLVQTASVQMLMVELNVDPLDCIKVRETYGLGRVTPPGDQLRRDVWALHYGQLRAFRQRLSAVHVKGLLMVMAGSGGDPVEPAGAGGASQQQQPAGNTGDPAPSSQQGPVARPVLTAEMAAAQGLAALRAEARGAAAAALLQRQATAPGAAAAAAAAALLRAGAVQQRWGQPQLHGLYIPLPQQQLWAAGSSAGQGSRPTAGRRQAAARSSAAAPAVPPHRGMPSMEVIDLVSDSGGEEGEAAADVRHGPALVAAAASGLWHTSAAATAAIAAAAADHFPNRFLPATRDAAQQRQHLCSLLDQLQLPLDAHSALHHVWGLEMVPVPGTAQAEALSQTYEYVRLLCNTSTTLKELQTLLQQVSGSWAPFSTLPDSALQHIFQLLCDSCPPQTPGTCWLAPVCTQWRDLTHHVKGLRVLFQGQQQQQADSFCDWLLGYAPQVKALALQGNNIVPVLRVLAGPVSGSSSSSDSDSDSDSDWEEPDEPSEPSVVGGLAIDAQDAGQPLPLQRLVVMYVPWLDPEMCFDTLGPLLAALPHLHHLHLPLWLRPSGNGFEEDAATSAVAPLQHSASLTSLVLDGPWYPEAGDVTDAVHQEILAGLPTSLRSLTWKLRDLTNLHGWSFGHLPALEQLSLKGLVRPVSVAAIASLPGQCRLALNHIPADDEGLLEYKERLVALGLGSFRHHAAAVAGHDDAEEVEDEPQVLPRLTQVSSLILVTESAEPTQQLLQQAPPLRELKVVLPEQSDPATEAPLPGGALPLGSPGVLLHYGSLGRLQRLTVTVPSAQAPPEELGGLMQLQQLAVHFMDYAALQQPNPVPWAQAVAGLVNLQVLRVPAELTTCWQPRWLTELNRLEVLEVEARSRAQVDVGSAAGHISSLLVLPPPAAAAPAGVMQPHNGSVRLVCFVGKWSQQGEQLRRAVAAAVPVLPPSKHLFNGSWKHLQAFGVGMWPEPLAARLRQLV